MNYLITYNDYQKQLIDMSMKFKHALNTGFKYDILESLEEALLLNIENSNTSYTKESTKEELLDLAESIDILTRMYLGQFQEINSYCAIRCRCFEMDKELISLKRKHFPNISYPVSYGIFNDKAVEHARVGYEIRGVINHYFNSEIPIYNSLPSHISNQPFITIQDINQ